MFLMGPRGPEGSQGGESRREGLDFLPKGSNFQGNFRNRVFLRGVKFPKEFLEIYARANMDTADTCFIYDWIRV